MTKTKTSLIVISAVVGLCAIVFIAARIMVVNVSPPSGNLGVSNGKLAPCPSSPNCVSSQADNPDKLIAPLAFTTSAEEARANLLAVLTSIPRLDIVESQPTYIHAESRSAMFGFIDDNEFFIDEEAGVVHVRAAARLGKSDLNKNRERVEVIRAAFNNTQ